MSIKTKVKKTGEFFQATTNVGPNKDIDRDAFPPLDSNTFYAGHLFPGSIVGSSQYVEFTEAVLAVIHGSELEEDTGGLLLVKF